MTPEQIRNELDRDVDRETLTSSSGKTYALVNGELIEVGGDDAEEQTQA